MWIVQDVEMLQKDDQNHILFKKLVRECQRRSRVYESSLRAGSSLPSLTAWKGENGPIKEKR